MHTDWWQVRQQELITQVHQKCPTCVYNEEVINDILFDLLSIDLIKGIFFPFYLNSHPKILEKACDMGLGFSCVSIQELKYLAENFPELNPEKIMYLHNNSPNGDLIEASKYSNFLVINHPGILEEFPVISEAREKKECLISLDSENDLEACSLPKGYINGFYICQDPNPATSDDLNRNISIVSNASNSFPESHTLILGNSMKSSLDHREQVLDIKDLSSYLEGLSLSFPGFSLYLEVPVFLVSFMGVLLVKVIETGKKENMPWISINMDKKSLKYIRPGIVHEIKDLTRMDDKKQSITMITAHDQGHGGAFIITKLPSSIQAGDILIITNMGIQDQNDNSNIQSPERVSEHYMRARRICQVKI